jgi:tetratricopeptide (TPR) repeat protein
MKFVKLSAVGFLILIISCTQVLHPSVDNNVSFEPINDYIRNKQFDSIVTQTSNLIKTDSKNALAYFYRAQGYAAQDKYDEALIDCNKAIDLDSNLTQAFVVRAYCYKNNNTLDKAITDSTKAQELNPKLAKTWFHIAESSHLTRDGYTSFQAIKTCWIRMYATLTILIHYLLLNGNMLFHLPD